MSRRELWEVWGRGEGGGGMGKDVSSILNTCFLSTGACQVFFVLKPSWDKKNDQVLNKATFCKSRQIYINILLDVLVGSSMGFFLGGEGRARRASQNTKDKIKYPTIALAKPSYNRFIIQLEGYKISSVNVDCSFIDNEWQTNVSLLQVQFSRALCNFVAHWLEMKTCQTGLLIKYLFRVCVRASWFYLSIICQESKGGMRDIG